MNEMKQIFDENKIKINQIQIEMFDVFYQLLIEWNKKMNLTAITDYEEVIQKHFLDSCLLLKKCPEQRFEYKKVIDVGTGAGFPGIPLAILLKDTQFTLMDSLNKRIEFLSIVIKELDLTNVQLFHGRAEEFGRNENFREQFDFCVSRAVASLPLLLEYCSPFVKVDGSLLLYKSKKISQEIEDAANALNVLNCHIVECMEVLNKQDLQRFVLEIEKKEHTPEKYPRKAGKPKKYPL